MYLLRRTAARAISASPSSALFVKPRSIATFAPSAFRSGQAKWTAPAFQRRFASDDAVKTGEAKEVEVEAATEASETFAQTAAEAPVEEKLTPADPADASAADASATDAHDQFDAAIGDRPPRNTGRSFGLNMGEVEPSQKLFVSNLFWGVKEDQIRRLFSRFGELTEVTLIRDNEGRSRGFGYVHFTNVDDARTAIENLHTQIYEGRNLVVAYHKAKPKSDSSKRVKLPPSNSLFIGNMSFEMSDADLSDLFRDIRNVVDVRVAIDRKTGQPRGFAHADFIDTASATLAREALNSKVVYGRELKVDFSKPRTERFDSQRSDRRSE